jgi:glycerophosphoryl diester phosphodiesterase
VAEIPEGKRRSRWRRRLRRGAAILAIVAFALWANNTSRFTKPDPGPTLLAHRGLGQNFPLEGVEGDTCTAKIIQPPEHPYLENTLPSMQAAFDAGADVVEFDVHLTKDNRFAVFHDWTLECRTEATGEAGDHTLEELQALDVGFGYTADGGKTFPFRGKGVGLIPSLEQVLEAFPDRQLLIDVKSGDPVEGERLADVLGNLSDSRREQLAVYGGNLPIAALKERLPDMRAMSRESLTRCLGWYLALGWSGYVPASCEATQVHVPEKYAPWMWGWPHKFVDRMAGHGTRVVFVAGDGGWSEGFDSEADVARLPDDFAGMIWTNRVDLVAPLLKD